MGVGKAGLWVGGKDIKITQESVNYSKKYIVRCDGTIVLIIISHLVHYIVVTFTRWLK